MENINEEHFRQIQREMIGLYKYKLQHLPHIKKYHKMRKMHQEIAQKMIDFSAEHPEEIYIDKIQYRQEYELMQRLYLDIEDDTDRYMMFDIVLYPYGINRDACNYFLEHKKVRTPEKINFVECMRASKLGLYEVIQVDSSMGRCEIRNLLTRERKKMIDESLAFNGDSLKDRCFMWRVIEVDDICFQTGFTFTYKKENLRRWIKKHKGHEIRLKELIDLYYYHQRETIKTFNVY